MRSLAASRLRPTQRILSVIRLFTHVVPGLYAGRVLAESLRPGPAGAIVLTLITTIAGAILLSRLFPRKLLWPAVALTFYVFYPALHPGIALATAAITIIASLSAYLRQVVHHRFAPSACPAAVLVFVGAAVLYLATLAPDILPADSGELQLVAAQLGVAHPPGFALYTVIAHIATLLPVGPTAAYRVNALSAVIAAATLAFVFLSAVRLTRSALAGLIAAVALGTATTFWAQATTANVRSLTAFFAALAIYLLLLIRDRISDRQRLTGYGAGRDAGAPDHFPNRMIFLLALTLSLGVTHHPSLIFIALIIALALLRLDPSLLRQPARWRWPIAGLLLGLTPLIFFPLRALTATGAVRGVSPELATLSGFLQHVLALGFRGDLFAYTAPQELWARLRVMGNVMSFQFHWLLLAGMLLGFGILLGRQKRLALALAAAFALHTLVTATYRAPQTVEYMMPAYVPAALLLAGAIPERVPAPGDNWAALRQALVPLLAALLLVTAFAQGVLRYASFAHLNRDFTARKYAATLLRDAPTSSVVLADWHWANPLWYLQDVEGERPDVEVHYVFPTAEPYGETWARRIGATMAEGRAVIATHFDATSYQGLPAYEPLGDAFLFSNEQRLTLPDGYTNLEQTLGGQIELLGYHLDSAEFVPLRESVLTVAWRPIAGAAPPDITLFAHLVGGDGAIAGQQDIPAPARSDGITLTQLRITPRLATQPGDYALYTGAYESGNGRPLPAENEQARLLLASVPVAVMEQPPFTAHRLYAPSVAANQRLVGYDWDHTLAPRTRLYTHWRTDEGYVTKAADDPPPEVRLPPSYGPWGIVHRRQAFANGPPQYYVPFGEGIVWTGEPELFGETPPPGYMLTLVQHFAAGRPVQQDLVVSVRLIGYEPDGILWDWWDLHDAVPALGAIPTLKWINGSRVRDAHFLTVSPSAPAGQQLGGLLTIYDAFTQRPLPILDERITDQHLGVPLGDGEVWAR